jgi:hypothetical protein
MTDPLERMPMRPLPPGEDETRLAWKAAFARRVVVILALLCLVLSLGTTLVNVAVIRSNQESGRTVVDQIKNCTTPGRPCYERGQRQTATAVADINRVTLAAATCAARRPGQTAPEIRACVLDLLAKGQQRR